MFSEAKARRVTQFIECLKHTKGEFHGEPFKLLPWQEKKPPVTHPKQVTMRLWMCGPSPCIWQAAR